MPGVETCVTVNDECTAQKRRVPEAGASAEKSKIE